MKWQLFELSRRVGQLFELEIPRLKPNTVGQLVEFPKTKLMGSCLHSLREQVLGSCLNIPRFKTETVSKFFELPKTKDQNRFKEK